MRILTLSCLVVILCAGCRVRDPLYCDETKPCTDPLRPFCDLTGIYPESEGLGRTCIAIPWDAGAPDAAIDAALPAPDGRLADAGPACGNAIIEATETCDGAELGGNDCTTIGMGFVGGALACAADCLAFDVSACTVPPGCGDGMLNGAEQCDGPLLGGGTCGSATGGALVSGALGCTGGCLYDTAACYTCGNSTVQGPEVCDGANLAGATCVSLGHDGGALSCAAGCLAFNEAACTDCGDGVAQGAELCDGADLNGNNCTTIGGGYTGGALGCDPVSCTYDTSACTTPPNCPNGVINAGEDCDPPMLGGGTCSTATGGALVSGSLTCTGGCLYDTTGCYTCGNGTVQGPEVCDGANLAGETCFSLGHDGGVLACAAGCFAFEESSCTDCGDGIAEGSETCDGGDLDGATCTSFGPGVYSGGTLACNGSCSAYTTGGCYGPPTVPALRMPMNDTYLGSMFVSGSRRPIFQWDASTIGGGTSISYDLQYSTDPTFTGAPVINTMTITNHQPAADLAASSLVPVGARYYWRVRACAAGACSAYSSAFRLNVGRSDHDFNGDGYADLIVGAYGANAAYIYFGSAAGADSTADATLSTGATGESLGWSVASAGDVNADGFADVIVGAPYNDVAGTDAGRAYVYFGGAGATFNTTVDGTLTGVAGGDNFGNSVATAGDVNNDGFADVIVGAYRSDTIAVDAGAAYVFFGGAGAMLEITPDLTLTDSGSAAGDDFGADVASAGDVNGDGYVDFLVGSELSDVGGVSSGQAYLYFGGPAVDALADVVWPGAAGEQFAARLSSAGDVNKDGYADLLIGAAFSDVGAINAGRAYVYFGGSVFDTVSDATLQGAAAGDQFGIDVASAGDLNADGYSDIVVGAARNDFGALADSGRAYVYFGGAGAFNTVNDGAPGGAAIDDRFGWSAATAGDIDGDGDSDLVVGAWLNDGMATNAGRIYVYFGAPSVPLNTTADVTLSGPSAGAFFGYAVR